MITNSYKQAAKLLLEGKVGFVPTDTIYGLSCQYSNREAVEKIYAIKQRDYNKPFLVLIPDIEDIPKLGIKLSPNDLQKLEELWPAPVSVILPCPDEKLWYLHRGQQSLGVRLPDVPILRKLLKETGPIVSTSANLQNNTPAKSVQEAKNLFGEKIDFYLDAGMLDNPPSEILKLDKEGFIKVR